MTGTQSRRASRALPLELHWDARSPLPRRWVLPDGERPELEAPPERSGFDFTGQMRILCADVAARCEELRHIAMPRILVTFTPSRNRSRYGLQARVTPLRFRHGALTRRHGSTDYQVQRYYVNGTEMLYVLTFCLPRFLDQPYREKLVTIFHELYHISPAFDGDLRRHPGRYMVHSHSKSEYDSRMEQMARGYVANHPNPELFRFLRLSYRDLWDTYGGVAGVVAPRAKLLPLRRRRAKPQAASSLSLGRTPLPASTLRS
jgi:predicted metallopeptidase